MGIKTFRDLIAWQKGMELARRVYQATMKMPREEQFGLTSQMRRAAVSIPSNIAEGFGRQKRLEFLRFLRMARGSLMELQTQVILVEQLNCMQIPQELTALLNEADRVLQGLIRSLEGRKRKPTNQRNPAEQP
jgi:four helix bundle protein